MSIGSWFKKWRKRENDAAIQRAEDEFFDTPAEQRAEERGPERFRADYRGHMIMRDSDTSAGEDESADPEERLAHEEER
jgi:hypothetical protein